MQKKIKNATSKFILKSQSSKLFKIAKYVDFLEKNKFIKKLILINRTSRSFPIFHKARLLLRVLTKRMVCVLRFFRCKYILKQLIIALKFFDTILFSIRNNLLIKSEVNTSSTAVSLFAGTMEVSCCRNRCRCCGGSSPKK